MTDADPGSTAATRPGQRARWAPALAGLLVLATACAPTGDAGDGASVVFRFEPATPVVGSDAIEVRLVDAAGEPLDGAVVAIEANMNHAGMTPTFADLVESPSRPGVYLGEIDFTMGGDWFLLLEASWPDGRRVQRTLDVPGVRSR